MNTIPQVLGIYLKIYMQAENKIDPHVYHKMQQARSVTQAIFDNIDLMPAEFEMIPFLAASYTSLCKGCTDPRAFNYDPTAEVDDNSCL